jgi:hypothetical protein
MTKGRFDKLLGRIPLVSRDPAVLVETVKKLLVPSDPGGYWDHRLKRTAEAWKKLPLKERRALAADWFKRHPPLKTVEESIAEEKLANPWLHVLIQDTNGAGSNFYDGLCGEVFLRPIIRATKEKDDLYLWEVLPPWMRRKILPFAFTSMAEVPKALIALAASRKMAFKLDAKKLAPGEWHNPFGRVFVPKGDLRLSVCADSPEHVHEVDGLPGGQGLLFPKVEEKPNFNCTNIYAGLLMQSYEERGKETFYGLSMWGPFYAVEIEDTRFEREPLIPVCPKPKKER